MSDSPKHDEFPNSPEDWEWVWYELILSQILVKLLFLVCSLIFIYYERKRRRLKRPNLWPELNIPINGRWRVGLCECFSSPFVCLKVACCYYFLPMFVRSDLEDRSCNMTDCICGNLFPPWTSITTSYWNRRTLVQKLNIQEDAVDSCFIFTCCFPCAMGQHYMEVERGFDRFDEEGYHHHHHHHPDNNNNDNDNDDDPKDTDGLLRSTIAEVSPRVRRTNDIV